MSAEDWRTVSFAEDYDVSSLGRVRSWKRPGEPKILSAPVAKNGYRMLTLSIDGVRSYHTVHSLVAHAFHGMRPDGHEVRHLDGDKLNNVAANLRWGTRAENAQDTIRHGMNHSLNKTHCPAGHPYDETNTTIKGDGRRRCATCLHEQMTARNRRLGKRPRGSQTECKRGHEFTEENTRIRVDDKGISHRHCRVCDHVRYILRRDSATSEQARA